MTTTETHWTAFPLTGGTPHNMTDPQCRSRDVTAPIDSTAICVACARYNTEHRAHEYLPCRHLTEQSWTHNGSVNEHPSYWVTCRACGRNLTIVLGWRGPVAEDVEHYDTNRDMVPTDVDDDRAGY